MKDKASMNNASASFIAAAVGDALGWPFEGRARRVQAGRHAETSPLPSSFVDWTRSGSRSEPYREIIKAGEYSDDTQLLISTARSLLRGESWWEAFAFVELPTWLVYERGGGGATKRAAQSWLQGTPPWDSDKTRSSYFDAGGNGVCMRILPHVLVNHGSDHTQIARNIVRNGICTHGHPRALVGALLHAMSLWLSFRQSEMLEYGALVEEVIKGFRSWTSDRDITNVWSKAFSTNEITSYCEVWDDTVDETLELLEICRSSLKRGPLSVGPETLRQMGALDSKTNGSGTITAAAALFLASRYAASPLQGLIVAATTIGADTDTLASMTGAILGAIQGEEWLGRLGENVQDAKYIRNIARNLNEGEIANSPSQTSRISKSDNMRFADSLKRVQLGGKVVLPDGREGRADRIDEMYSGTAEANLIHVSLACGQTVAVKRIIRGAKKGFAQVKVEHSRPSEILRVGIKLFVSDLNKAREFYIAKLQFPIDKQYPNGFTMAGNISVLLAKPRIQQALDFRPEGSSNIVPCIRIANLDEIEKRLIEKGVSVKRVDENHSYKAIQVIDPFGNVLELFQA
jgi:ADP-ribosylglycohydrolase